MKRARNLFTVLAVPVAVAVFAFGGSNAGGVLNGPYDGTDETYWKIYDVEYQCGTFDEPYDEPDAGPLFGMWGAANVEWNYPDNTSFSGLIEVLSPYTASFLDTSWTDATGESGSSTATPDDYGFFPIDPPGYPVVLRLALTMSVGGLVVYQQEVTLTCAAEGPATSDETESFLTTTTIPAGVPDPPTGVTATLGSVIVSWTPPAYVGVSGITGYVITASPGGAAYNAGPSATSLTIACPTPGDYTYTVQAVNAYGPSAASVPSNSVSVTAAQCHDTIGAAVATPRTTG